MPTFRTTREVRHAPDRMFALVADVERYPEFLPLCESLRVLRREPGEGDGQGDRTETIVADMAVGYKAIREHFTTRVTLDRPAHKIAVTYIEGPFRHLDNRWTFREGPRGCTVEFYITYEFKSRMLGLLMGSMFEKAFAKFAEAFERRADRVYGVPAA